jgi:hypothetical protein
MFDEARSRRPQAAVLGVLFALVMTPATLFGQNAPDDPATALPAATADEETTSDTVDAALVGTLGLLVNPVYPPDQARLVYQPLVDYINNATELDVELIVERNFHRYWINARRNEAPALILEDAHMVAWRMARFDYQPLVTTRQPKTFSLLASGALADSELADFIGRRISSLPSPSLGYLVLADWFDNPLQQPVIRSAATSWLDAVEMVFSAESDAAIAPDTLVTKYPNLYPIRTSPEFPGLTLTASPDVPDGVRRILVDALIVLDESAEHQAALFELDIEGFDEADPEDFAGLESWLDPIFSL